MHYRWPFLTPFVCISVGMVVSVMHRFSADNVILSAAFICLLLACFQPSRHIFSLCAGLFFFVAGPFVIQPWLSPVVPTDSIRLKASDQPVTIEGIIADRPSVAPDASRMTVRVERVLCGKLPETVSGDLLLSVSSGDIPFSRGDRIRFVSRVTIPHRLGLPGEFDYARYLAFHGITATARVKSHNDIVLMRSGATRSLQRTLDQTARLLGDTIRRAVPDEQISSVLTALLIGDQRRIPGVLADAYTRAGVNHILSISGFHIGVIAAFISLLAVWFLTRIEYVALRCDARKTALLIAIPAMLLYLFLTGNAPATARSVIMLVIFSLALFSERELDSINSLLFAAFLLIALNPPTLFDVSFQLSFISLWGILIAIPPIRARTAGVDSRPLRYLLLFVATSAAASCVTLLPVLYIFNVASFNGVLTNFLIVPLLGYGAVLAGFVVLPLVIMFPATAPLALWPAAALVELANRFILWCNNLPVMVFHGITAVDLTFFLLFMLTITFVKQRVLFSVAIATILVCAIVLHMSSTATRDGRLHVTMLSVGQAESLLVQLPDGSTLLVDGGGYLHDTGHDFGQRVLAPALGALHIRKIDTIISTHDHPDHSGGLPYLIQNIPVGEFWSSSRVSSIVQSQLNSSRVTQRILRSGDIIPLAGNVLLTVLSPQHSAAASYGSGESSVNEESLVFRLSYGAFSMLFCADAGFEAENSMLEGRSTLKSTVLKVGHHGSRFSTSARFLDRVSPEIALISVGTGNRFGLPSPRTIDLLVSRHISLYRTDRDGTIELSTDGVSWSVSTPFNE